MVLSRPIPTVFNCLGCLGPRAPSARAASLNLPLPSSLTWPMPSSSHHVILLFRALRGPPVTPPKLLGSLSPSLPAFTLHLPWSIGMNLSFDLHHTSSTVMSHPTPAHHELTDTSNPLNVINHSSSKGYHHWSSLMYKF